MRKAEIVVMIMFLIFCLSGCSEKVIYSDKGMTISRVETESGKELYADMSIYPIQMSEEAEESLTASEPLTEYEVQLSDGVTHGYQGMENEEPHVYAYTHESLSDIADSIRLDILASDMMIYPENDNNFLLLYDNNGRTRSVSINGAEVELEKDYHISYMDIYMCFGPETDRARYSLQNITDEADYATYAIAGGEQAHLLYDLSVGKGAVLVRIDGAFYIWELEGIKDLDDLHEFADSINWVKSSNE